ncbi:hypothetical protein OAH22_00095 [bacterium]|nr:hypothetical protein [bacterium]
MEQVGVFNAGMSDGRLSTPGTLMWVSADTGSEFSQARQYCIAHAPQIAMRASVGEGLGRPAAEVRAIVVAQNQRTEVSRPLIRDLREAYPQARILCLMGACCEGMYAKVLDPVFSKAERVYCHQWAQVLPEWLRCCGALVTPEKSFSRSVAVVSATPAIGSALMDLAESAGAVTLWCRDVCSWQMRQVDAVWWDDSVAGAVSATQWKERLEKCSTADQSPVHAWIANAPRCSQVKAAAEGGISLTLSKPHRIEPLLSLLENCRPGQAKATEGLRVA